MISVIEHGAGGVPIVVLHGPHDVSAARAVDAELDRVQQHARRLVVDLTPADFVDSSIVGVLLTAQRRAERNRARLAIVVGREGMLRRVLHIAGLLEALPVFDTQAEAIAAVSGGDAASTVSSS